MALCGFDAAINAIADAIHEENLAFEVPRFLRDCGIVAEVGRRPTGRVVP